jgi:aerobic-type carbon monoxide dehydrogenase small subunit (CoxS/CutS family)
MRDRDEHTRSGPPADRPAADGATPPTDGPPDPVRSGFSRRDFLRGSGVAVAATALATQNEAGAQESKKLKPNVVAAEPRKLKLNVNGKDHEVTVEPRTTLLTVLRNDLNLTGCKEVDDRDAAGADTVIIDGKAVAAGARLAVECEGQKIRTVESLWDGKTADPVVEGFVKHDAMQCGFCTPGFVMAMRAFVDKNPTASDQQIRDGLGGNICRCGTYDGIMKCARELTKGGN